MWWIRHGFLCAIPNIYATSWLWALFDDHDVGREAVNFRASPTGKPSIWIWFQSHFLCDHIGVYWSVSMKIRATFVCSQPFVFRERPLKLLQKSAIRLTTGECRPTTPRIRIKAMRVTQPLVDFSRCVCVTLYIYPGDTFFLFQVRF